MIQQQTQAVTIGASAGALEALLTVLPQLPETFPAPIFIVVHLPPDKNSMVAELLGGRCQLTVTEAQDKELSQPGHVYIAPPDYHLLVEADGSMSLSSDEPVHYSRPSIDVLFESAADAYGDGLVGVVLTGANDDGASGLKLIAEYGGRALVQDPAEASASAMPKAALTHCPKAEKLSLDGIANYLNRLT